MGIDHTNLIKTVAAHTGSRPEKFFKATLFRGDALLLGLNCLEPGQVQAAHDHPDQDKFYYVVSGTGRFTLGDAEAAGHREIARSATRQGSLRR